VVAVRFGDLAREYAAVRGEIDAAVGRVLAGGRFVLGPEVEALEREFAAYVGTSFCVGVASGTEAIAVALMAGGVGPGDEVITVAHTAVGTVAAISMVGATPVFVDVHPETGLMNVAAVASAVTARTRAVIPVHLYGQCVEMPALLRVAARVGVTVVEDAAQAHGAAVAGRRAGAFGSMGCFSFYPSKNLGCYGDGGAVTTSDAGLHERLRMLRNYGQVTRYHHRLRGLNSRLDELQAAILRTKLLHLEAWNARRRQLAARYQEGLRGMPLRLPSEPDGPQHVHHLYVVQSERRDALQHFLADHGVETFVHYPLPVHRQEAYLDLGYPLGSLPVSERLAGAVLSLPLYPHLADAEVERVIEIVRRFFG
jgi:dTDP-3-amino-3,4,6-trideoxy-alpha-D-glucose transaminase